MRKALVVLLASLFVPFAASAQVPDIALELWASGFNNPVAIAHAGDGSNRAFVVERGGTVAIVQDGLPSEEPFLDISDRISADRSEQGLLGMAMAPDFAESGIFYLYYTAENGDNTVSRFQTAADGTLGDPDSEEVLIAQEDFAWNHNGGQLAFGPDGYLYIGMGDGGGGGDPENNGQDLTTLLGKLLRIDVGGETGYTIPADNPFVGEDAREEIWAYGLRNPWRFSFDRETGDLFVADVGQNAIEEISLLPAGVGGQNLGWSDMEGSACFNVDPCEDPTFTLPVAEYTHDVGGCSVTGGYVARGESPLAGTYFFGDYCTGYIWGLTGDVESGWTMSDPYESGLSISTFGELEDGTIVVADLNSGEIYRIV